MRSYRDWSDRGGKCVLRAELGRSRKGRLEQAQKEALDELGQPKPIERMANARARVLCSIKQAWTSMIHAIHELHYDPVSQRTDNSISTVS